jgi:lipid A 4'-phosphatase
MRRTLVCLGGNGKDYAILFLAISTILAITFMQFPQIDLFVSGFFYKEGQKFYLDAHPILMFLHGSVTYITATISVLWIGLLIATSIRKQSVWGLSRLRVIYLLLALIVGPGLVINSLFKENWGRARPSQVEMFGGVAKFTPAFVISDQCPGNCSFVSGDPSVGFYFLALALAIPARRRFFVILAIASGFVLGATRVMQGAHFFSDVIFSGIFTCATVFLLYWGLLKIEARNNRHLQ